MNKSLIKKIEDICEDHLADTDIKKILLCEDSHDHYLLKILEKNILIIMVI